MFTRQSSPGYINRKSISIYALLVTRSVALSLQTRRKMRVYTYCSPTFTYTHGVLNNIRDLIGMCQHKLPSPLASFMLALKAHLFEMTINQH